MQSPLASVRPRRITRGVGALVMSAATLSAVAVSTQLVSGGVAAASSSYVAPSSMRLAFDQGFGGSSLDTSVWGTCWPGTKTAGCTNWGNSQEEEWYLPSQDQVSNGALHLVAVQTPTQGTTQSGAPKTYQYASGMVTSAPSFSFTYGYLQVTARIPGGTGTWPALWLLPANGSWPPEIDVMENWGSANAISTTYWWGVAGNLQHAATQVVSASDLTSGWHTYGLLWEPGSLTWYLDGAPVFTYTGSSVPSQAMYLIANLAVDGPAASGSSFDIQSVQVWDAQGASSSSGPPPICGAALPPGQTAVGMVGTPDGGGYWVATDAGAVIACGDAPDYGQVTSALSAPVVGMAGTPDGRGYWLVAADGGVFSFGDAGFHGSAGAIPLARPVVGMAPTADGNGYWLVASDGGIFSYGDARFLGSMGAVALNQPVVGMALDRSSGGYWLVAADGGIFSFGAPFFGSTGALRLNKPIVGMEAAPDGSGYRFVASDGGVFCFDTPFDGSMGGGAISQPMTGMSADATSGYWTVARDGGIFSFGGAGFFGTPA